MTKIVELKKHALEEVIRSAYEDYNRETFGNLFGYSFERENRLIRVIEQAHRTSIGRKLPTKVENIDTNSGAYKRAHWSSQEFLGVFHSHTSYWNNEKYKKGKLSLSQKDLEFMKDENLDIFLTIAINETTKNFPVITNLFYFSATLSDYDKKYRVKLGAYYFDKRKRRAVIKVKKKDLREIFR